MHYRRLGNSELEVSEIALGSWLTYGVGVERDRARDCLKRAFDCGINFVDTANVYGRGKAETLLGELLAPYRRDSYVLATKVYFPMSSTDRGLSRAQILKQLDASLARLRTDHVDLYQCHRYDESTPLAETMEALTEVVRAGKARYIGFSEWSPQQIRAAADMPGVERFVSSQPQYSMLWREPEQSVFPLCRRLGIGQIVWSPLAQGVLTGKYAPGRPAPKDSRASSDAMGGFIGRYLDDDVLRGVQRLQPVASALGISLAQLALAWALRSDDVTAAIVGATRPEQVEQNAAASGVVLDAATIDSIEAILRDIPAG